MADGIQSYHVVGEILDHTHIWIAAAIKGVAQAVFGGGVYRCRVYRIEVSSQWEIAIDFWMGHRTYRLDDELFIQPHDKIRRVMVAAGEKMLADLPRYDRMERRKHLSSLINHWRTRQPSPA